MTDLDSLLKDKQETASIEFKSEFDGSQVAWLEIIKDIVGIANSGGGFILFGFDSQSQLSGKDVSVISATDPAVLTDKIRKHTSVNFSNFKITAYRHLNTDVCVLEIGFSDYPIIFTTAGNYQVNGKTVSAFQVGTVYFRHGAKTEPADNQDLRQFIDKKIERIRGAWMDGLRQVIEAPEGSIVKVFSAEDATRNAQDIHLTDDLSAPFFRIENIDETHPLRGSTLFNNINRIFHDGTKHITNYDILCANEYLKVNDDYNYIYRQKQSVIKYTPAYLKLLIAKYKEDSNFFLNSRIEVANARKSR